MTVLSGAFRSISFGKKMIVLVILVANVLQLFLYSSNDKRLTQLCSEMTPWATNEVLQWLPLKGKSLATCYEFLQSSALFPCQSKYCLRPWLSCHLSSSVFTVGLGSLIQLAWLTVVKFSEQMLNWTLLRWNDLSLFFFLFSLTVIFLKIYLLSSRIASSRTSAKLTRTSARCWARRWRSSPRIEPNLIWKQFALQTISWLVDFDCCSKLHKMGRMDWMS